MSNTERDELALVVEDAANTVACLDIDESRMVAKGCDRPPRRRHAMTPARDDDTELTWADIQRAINATMQEDK